MAKSLELEIAQAEYKRLAKLADQKLRRLEKQAEKSDNVELLRYAYSRAVRDIKSHGGNKRFDIKPPDDIREVRKMTADARRFFDADTSSVTGFKKIQRSRTEKFNQSMGTNFTEKEFTKLMELGVFELLKKDFGFGYKTATRIAKQLMKNKKNILNRKKEVAKDTLTTMLSKYKFKGDQGLYKKVQGVIGNLD